MIDKNEKQRALAKARIAAAREEVRLHKEALNSIPKGKGGRPAGSSNFTPLALANSRATAEVLIAKDQYRKGEGRGNVPKEETEELIDFASWNNPGANKKTVRNSVLRGKIKRLRSKALSQKL
jgi:hypothetical protein